MPLALRVFNIGVAVGQLMVVVVVLLAGALLRRLCPRLTALAAAPGGLGLRATGHAVGTLAAFRAIDRMTAF